MSEPWVVPWEVRGPFKNWRGRDYWAWSTGAPRSGIALRLEFPRESGRASSPVEARTQAKAAAASHAARLNSACEPPLYSGEESGGVWEPSDIRWTAPHLRREGGS